LGWISYWLAIGDSLLSPQGLQRYFGLKRRTVFATAGFQFFAPFLIFLF
jgi:hypothetical protein